MKFYPMIKAGLCAAVLAVLATPAFANSLQVTDAAAVDGQKGLQITLDGGSDGAYVQDDSPAGESTYRVSFWLERADDLFMSNCSGTCSTRFVSFVARQNSPGVTVFRVIFARMASDGPGGAQYLARFGVRNDNGDFLYVGGTILTSTQKRKHVTLEWQAGDPFTNNGSARLYTSNTGGTPNLQSEITGIQNGTMVVDYIWMGAVSGLGDQANDPLSSGSIYFDSFASYRTLLP